MIKIIDSGCDTVCISGGEPLLEPGRAISIMQQLQNKGISVYLSTNGTNYLKNTDKIEFCISKLSLPLDGYNDEINTINGRNAGSFKTVLSILEYYKHNPAMLTLKINTVITSKNMYLDNLKNMYLLLRNYKIDIWEIYEFIPENRGIENKESLSYLSSEYQNLKSEFLKYVKNERDMHIEFSDRNQRSSVYFIIQPDGSVIIPIDRADVTEELLIGDLKTESIASVINNWNYYADTSKHSISFAKRKVI